MKDDFSERFRLLCEVRGLKTSKVAALAGVNPSMASRWLRVDKPQAPRDRADVVARVLGMSLARLYATNLNRVRSQLARVGKAAA